MVKTLNFLLEELIVMLEVLVSKLIEGKTSRLEI
jgi:hypothetical protein